MVPVIRTGRLYQGFIFIFPYGMFSEIGILRCLHNPEMEEGRQIDDIV